MHGEELPDILLLSGWRMRWAVHVAHTDKQSMYNIAWKTLRKEVICEAYGWKGDDIKVRGCIQKFPDWVDNEINKKNKHSLIRNTKC